jgi:hypothetical protein
LEELLTAFTFPESSKSKKLPKIGPKAALCTKSKEAPSQQLFELFQKASPEGAFRKTTSTPNRALVRDEIKPKHV